MAKHFLYLTNSRVISLQVRRNDAHPSLELLYGNAGHDARPLYPSSTRHAVIAVQGPQ